MVLEDEDLLMDLIETIGSRSGWDVVKFNKIEPAWEDFSINKGKYDIALIDICLGPDDWGPDLAKMIKKVDPNFMMIFMTGSGDDIISKAMKDSPGIPVLKKPFKLSEFRDNIRRALLSKSNKKSIDEIEVK